MPKQPTFTPDVLEDIIDSFMWQHELTDAVIDATVQGELKNFNPEALKEKKASLDKIIRRKENTSRRQEYRQAMIRTVQKGFGVEDTRWVYSTRVLNAPTHEQFVKRLENESIAYFKNELNPQETQNAERARVAEIDKNIRRLQRDLPNVDLFSQFDIEYQIIALKEQRRLKPEPVRNNKAPLFVQIYGGMTHENIRSRIAQWVTFGTDSWCVEQARQETAKQATKELRARVRELCGPGDTYTFPQAVLDKRRSEHLTRYGFVLEQVAQERAYYYGPNAPTEGAATKIDPEAMSELCLTTAVERCRTLPLNDKEQRKLDILLQFATGAVSGVPQDIVGLLYKPTRQLLRQNMRAVLRGAAGAEIAKFLEMKPKDEYLEKLLFVIDKYRPEAYLNEFARAPNDNLLVKTLTTVDALEASLVASGSCIKGTDRPDIAKMLNDPGAVFLGGYANGTVMGYARLFLMQTREGEKTVAIDTIELDTKNFEKNRPLLNALAYASISLAKDIGAKYVLGYDARLKYGPSDAFGDTKRKKHLLKVGQKSPVKVQNFQHNAEVDSYVIMQHWDV